MSDLDRLEAAVGECREMIREAHAATKDLRAAVREAKREMQDLAKDEVAAHIQGGAARLTEAQVSIMQRKTKRWPDACAAERRRAAPYTRPDKISAGMCPLVRGVHSNPLRSRERRFESCRGHQIRTLSRRRFHYISQPDTAQEQRSL